MASSSDVPSGVRADNSKGALLWCMTSSARRAESTCATRDAALLVYNLNYARSRPPWMDHVLRLPNSGVETYVDKDGDGVATGNSYHYFDFPLVEHWNDDQVVARFEKDGQLERAVDCLRRAGVEITMDHVSLLCEQTRLGFVLIDHSIKPYLYQCLTGYYNKCDEPDERKRGSNDDYSDYSWLDDEGISSNEDDSVSSLSDDDETDDDGVGEDETSDNDEEETDGEGDEGRLSSLSQSVRNARQKVRRLKEMLSSRGKKNTELEDAAKKTEESIYLPFTVRDLLSCMDALLGVACLYAMLGCDDPTSRVVGDAWNIVLSSVGRVTGDLVDDIHSRAVEEIVRKMCALHVLSDRTSTLLNLFNNDRIWKSVEDPYAGKPRLESLMLDGLKSGKVCVPLPPSMASCLLEGRIPRLAIDSPNRWSVDSFVSEPIWTSVHRSKILTDVAFANDPSLVRDFCARCDVDRVEEGERPTASSSGLSPNQTTHSFSQFTICANWKGEAASVKVNTWLLLSRWPWFQDLVTSGLEEARTMSVTIPTPLRPQSLFFVASLIYSPESAMWDRVELNQYWQEGIDACECMQLTRSNLVQPRPRPLMSNVEVRSEKKKKKKKRNNKKGRDDN